MKIFDEKQLQEDTFELFKVKYLSSEVEKIQVYNVGQGNGILILTENATLLVDFGSLATQTLMHGALYDDDPALINTELETLMEISPEQIKNAVNDYLNNDNRALLDVVPAGKV